MSGALIPGVFPWPVEAVTFLREQRKAGTSHTVIANQLSAKYGHTLSRNAVIGKCQRLGIEGPSRDAQQAAAKINRARMSPSKFLTAAERVMPEAVATRRVVDLIRAEKREAEPSPRRADPDALATSPCCLLDLRSASCRWPLNRKAADGQALFCNNDQEDGSSYCGGHRKIAHQHHARTPAEIAADIKRRAYAQQRTRKGEYRFGRGFRSGAAA